MDPNPGALHHAVLPRASEPAWVVNNFNSFHVHSLLHLPNKLIMETLKDFQRESHY